VHAIIGRIAGERGAAVLLSTHLLAEVEEICSRVLILNRGRVVAHGTVADITRRAAANRTAAVRVAPEDAGRARAALSPFVIDTAGTGTLRVALNGAGPNDVLRLLVEADVAVLTYELEAARLSDAFLAMTETV
jgi:ABC-2 type transport system ATP-binding protein